MIASNIKNSYEGISRRMVLTGTAHALTQAAAQVKVSPAEAKYQDQTSNDGFMPLYCLELALRKPILAAVLRDRINRPDIWSQSLRSAHCQLLQAGAVHIWKPIWHILSDGEFALVMANAKQGRNVPGRKTDVNDAM